MENDLILSNQFMLKAVNSLINQLLSITHEIWKLFYCRSNVKGVSIDIAKAFEKI